MNAVEIEQAISDLALQPFDAAEFPFAFLAAFGNKDTTLKRLRKGNEQRLRRARRRAPAQQHPHRRLPPAAPAPGCRRCAGQPGHRQGKAKFILATDGETLEAEDLAAGETIACDYPTSPTTSASSCRWPASPPSRRSRTTPSTCAPPAA
jgi:hypothetical protein